MYCKHKIFSLTTIAVIIMLFLGIFLRVKFLLLNESFWYDTCALAANIRKPFIDLFKPLEFLQVAPPLFMVLAKLICPIFNNAISLEQKDFILRLIPFVSSCISLLLFPVAVYKMFSDKIITAVCTFFFCFNYWSVYFSQEFKPYSSDCLITVIILLIFFSVDIKQISKKLLFLISLFFALSIWISNTAVLLLISGFTVLAADCIKQKYFDWKKITILILPLAISCLTFLLLYFIPVYNELSQKMLYHWHYLNPSFFTAHNFLYTFTEKLNNLTGFYGLLGSFIFLIINIAVLIIKGNYKIKIMVLLPIILTVLLNFFNMYPFEKRLILFLLPLFIIIYSQLFLLIKNNKVNQTIIIIALMLFSFHSFNDIQNKGLIYNKSNIRELYEILKEKNPELKNVISLDMLYVYYSAKESIYSVDMAFYDDFSKSNIQNYINNLKEDDYWILIPDSLPVWRNNLLDYLKNNTNIQIKELYVNEEYPNTFLALIVKK